MKCLQCASVCWIARRFCPEPPVGQVPEQRIFDKADQAEEQERLHLERSEIETRIAELDEQLKSADEDQRPALEGEVARLRRRCHDIAEALESSEVEE